MGFSRQGYWSGLPCPLPEDLSNPGIKSTSLTSPELAGGFLCGTQQFPEASLEGWYRERRGCGKRLEVQGGTQCTVQFSRSVVSDSLQPHGLQHARPPCPSPTPKAYPNSCPSRRWCHPTISSSSSPSPPTFNLSQHWGLFSESVLRIRWPKYWSFSFSISPSNEYSGLISFRMHWSDLLAFQGTFKSLLQHHGSKASILWCSAFFIVQLSHTYMTSGKTIALTRWTW